MDKSIEHESQTDVRYRDFKLNSAQISESIYGRATGGLEFVSEFDFSNCEILSQMFRVPYLMK